jgi:hypothetical protein
MVKEKKVKMINNDRFVVHYLFCCLFVLSVILRLTTSDYNLGISKLFLQYTVKVAYGFIVI